MSICRSISLLAAVAIVAAPLSGQGEVREFTVDATSDAEFALVDLGTGTVLPAGTADSVSGWQLGVQRYTLRLAPGVKAKLLIDNTLLVEANPMAVSPVEARQRFDAVGAADIPADEMFTSSLPASVSVDDSPPFVYGIDPGQPHAVLPTHNIYLIRDGDAVYKVQFLSYYQPVTGAARFITVRVATVRP